jgi:hypothetical protein
VPTFSDRGVSHKYVLLVQYMFLYDIIHKALYMCTKRPEMLQMRMSRQVRYVSFRKFVNEP